MQIEFTNEEGTGLGPTLEFYALVSAELQRKSLAMWLTDDSDPTSSTERTVDIGHGVKQPGYYIQVNTDLRLPLVPSIFRFTCTQLSYLYCRDLVDCSPPPTHNPK